DSLQTCLRQLRIAFAGRLTGAPDVVVEFAEVRHTALLKAMGGRIRGGPGPLERLWRTDRRGGDGRRNGGSVLSQRDLRECQRGGTKGHTQETPVLLHSLNSPSRLLTGSR